MGALAPGPVPVGSLPLPPEHELCSAPGANESPNVLKGLRSLGKRSHCGRDGPGVPEAFSDLKLNWACHLTKTFSQPDRIIQQ